MARGAGSHGCVGSGNLGTLAGRVGEGSEREEAPY